MGNFLNSTIPAGALVMLGLASVVAQDIKPLVPQALNRPVLEVTGNLQLDPTREYGPIVVTASNVTIDGQGLTLVGSTGSQPKAWKGTAVKLAKVKNVTLKNFKVRGWEIGLHAQDVSGLTVENCDFSDNFHDPDFGWGENGRRGGMVLERVTKSTVRKNKANRVWDACVLVDSHDNTLEDNDFSHTSNTCLKLWTSSRNVIRRNVLSHGIRIAPQEVHARDSTSVLIESGSNDNRLLDNDCTYGGDGIFVRVLNGWCSTGNHFEGNDCSYANNNGVECWAPRNVFVRNKANHCSYGFWMGGSDQSLLLENEASHNGEKQGNHNSPHLPGEGHAGIVFMFGPSSHSIARGNICRHNNGAGIAVIGDIESGGKKWNAYHWIIEQNILEQNRWGIYLRFADWLNVSGNRFSRNSVSDVQNDGGVQRLLALTNEIAVDRKPPQAVLTGPTSALVGEEVAFDAGTTKSPAQKDVPLQFAWDFGDGQIATTPQTKHIFRVPGFYRLGLTVHDGQLSDLAARDFYVVDSAPEVGTEGQAANWVIDQENDPKCRIAFRDDDALKIAGKSSIAAVVDPYHGLRVGMLYPRTRDLKWKLAPAAQIVFWLKTQNPNLPGFQDVNPVVTLFAADGTSRKLTPKKDFLSQPPYNEARDGWRYFAIPVAGDAEWAAEGKLPELVSHLTIGIDSWGGDPLKFWIDGLATK